MFGGVRSPNVPHHTLHFEKEFRNFYSTGRHVGMIVKRAILYSASVGERDVPFQARPYLAEYVWYHGASAFL